LTLSIASVSNFFASAECSNHLKNSSILSLLGAIHVGTVLFRIESKPGSVANNTGLGAELMIGVLPVPAGPYTIALQPNLRAKSLAGRKSEACISIFFFYMNTLMLNNILR